MRYVIIGNSYAAVGAVESIRELDQAGEIVIISDEPYRAYGRPLITYWIAGAVSDVPNQVDSDCHVVDLGIISLTPLRLDLTARDVLAGPPGWPLAGYTRTQ